MFGSARVYSSVTTLLGFALATIGGIRRIAPSEFASTIAMGTGAAIMGLAGATGAGSALTAPSRATPTTAPNTESALEANATSTNLGPELIARTPNAKMTATIAGIAKIPPATAPVRPLAC